MTDIYFPLATESSACHVVCKFSMCMIVFNLSVGDVG